MKIKYPNKNKYQTEEEYREACHEAFENAYKQFKRESKEIIVESKRRQYFESKSEIARRQKKRASRREQAIRRKAERELENSTY